MKLEGDIVLDRKKVDYVLKTKGKENRMFIEVKNFNSDLNPDNYKQIINYCLLKNVELGLLTNGKQWWVYHFNSSYNSLAEPKNVCKIDFCKDKYNRIRELFNNLLSKETIESGSAAEYAQNF